MHRPVACECGTVSLRPLDHIAVIECNDLKAVSGQRSAERTVATTSVQNPFTFQILNRDLYIFFEVSDASIQIQPSPCKPAELVHIPLRVKQSRPGTCFR